MKLLLSLATALALSLTSFTSTATENPAAQITYTNNDPYGVSCPIFFEYLDIFGGYQIINLDGMLPTGSTVGVSVDADYTALTPFVNQHGNGFTGAYGAPYGTEYQICCNGDVYRITVLITPGYGPVLTQIDVIIDPVPELGCETDPHD